MMQNANNTPSPSLPSSLRCSRSISTPFRSSFPGRLGSGIFFTFCLFFSVQIFAAEKTAFHPVAAREGFYTSMSTGRVMFTGGDRSLYNDGWVVGFKGGYDIWKYFGVEGIFKLSGHPSSFATTSPTIPKTFFVYQYIAQLRGAYPITKRLHAELGMGAGIFTSSPNQNGNSKNNRPMFYSELGLQYFMRTRGISVGLDPSISGVTNLKGAVVQLTGFLRYTF